MNTRPRPQASLSGTTARLSTATATRDAATIFFIAPPLVRRGPLAAYSIVPPSHLALKEARHQGPHEVGVVRLVAVVVRMAEPVVGVGERVPLDEPAIGDEALPEWRLDGRGGNEVLTATEHLRRARQGLRQLERVSRAMCGLG